MSEGHGSAVLHPTGTQEGFNRLRKKWLPRNKGVKTFVLLAIPVIPGTMIATTMNPAKL
jgi:hypothetical protein